MPDLAAVNGLADPTAERVAPEKLIVGSDILGGRFAINGGSLSGDLGEVNYWGPDTLAWSPIGLGHSAFVRWALAGGTNDFYRSLRWNGWEAEVSRIADDEGLMVFPPPCTSEGRDIDRASRKPVPWTELIDWLATLEGLPEGRFRVRVDPAPSGPGPRR